MWFGMESHAIMLLMLVQMHVNLTHYYLHVKSAGKFLNVVNFISNKRLRNDHN